MGWDKHKKNMSEFFDVEVVVGRIQMGILLIASEDSTEILELK